MQLEELEKKILGTGETAAATRIANEPLSTSGAALLEQTEQINAPSTRGMFALMRKEAGAGGCCGKPADVWSEEDPVECEIRCCPSDNQKMLFGANGQEMIEVLLWKAKTHPTQPDAFAVP